MKKNVKIKNLTIGNGSIPIQTMLKNRVKETDLTLKKIKKFANMGCDIIRISVPDEDELNGLKIVLKESPIPIVADIHFDYRLAIKSIEAGVHKVRINPGNIGNEDRVKEIIQCLKEYNIPVRIGINGGSLPKHLTSKYKNSIDTMIESAKEEIGYFEKYGYDKIVLSFKSSSVIETIEVNEKASTLFPFPLHIGVTEAGDLIDGTVKNSIGISALLQKNIGDTIRVSLTAPEENEIIVGKKILESLGKREELLEIISCPTCGRTNGNISQIVVSLKEKIAEKNINRRIKIAVMGCVVNGPGEASNATFGVACGNERSIIFENGEKLKTVDNTQILDELMILLEKNIECHDKK